MRSVFLIVPLSRHVENPPAMHRNRSAILVTGFGPFPGAPQNASSLLAEALAKGASRRLPGYAIYAETLPTEWHRGPARLAELLSELDPVVSVHFGVSHRARGFVVETRARNTRQDSLDACGAAPGEACISSDGPVELTATLPTTLIAERLRRRGLPVQLSRDAGAYLCNAVMYCALDHARRREESARAPRGGFIHIPDRLVTGHGSGTRRARPCLLDWDDAIEGGIEILTACVGTADR